MSGPRFDDVIHARNRLQVCALLASAEALDFRTVRETLEVSESVLSKHVRHLTEAGYLDVEKKPHGIRTRTWLSLTDLGRTAYEGHLAELRRIVGAVDAG